MQFRQPKYIHGLQFQRDHHHRNSPFSSSTRTHEPQEAPAKKTRPIFLKTCSVLITCPSWISWVSFHSAQQQQQRLFGFVRRSVQPFITKADATQAIPHLEPSCTLPTWCPDPIHGFCWINSPQTVYLPTAARVTLCPTATGHQTAQSCSLEYQNYWGTLTLNLILLLFVDKKRKFAVKCLLWKSGD